jgi:DNA polymerase I
MEKLYVLDAVNFLFRSYYAIGSMTNPKGESTNALYGFIRSLNKLIKDFSPSHLVAVFDGPDNKQKRTEIYKEYKAHRKGMPEDLFPQLEKALQFCEIAAIPHLSVPGVEADDVMGSIAKWAAHKGTEIFLCTSDKDLCQLISDKIFVINPYKENLLIDKKTTKELFGVYPEQMVDYLALVGDASDNIPGLEGFGPKTAAQLLNAFDSLDALLKHPEKVGGKKGETLKEERETALLSRRLATIDTDVDFPKKESFFKLTPPDEERLVSFYQEMHFLSLLKERGISPTKPKGEPDGGEEYSLVDEEELFDDLMQKLGREKEICLDTETTDLHPMKAELVGIGFASAPKKAWYVPLNGKLNRKKVIARIKDLIENSGATFYGHNIKYDMHVLLNEGISLTRLSFDTLIASYLLSPQSQRHNLDHITLERFGKIKIPIEDLIGKGRHQISMSQVPLEKISTYCCEDVDYTSRLKREFQTELEKKGLLSLFHEIELPLIPILMKMERSGIYVDQSKLSKISEELTVEIEKLEHEICTMAHEKFNLNSPKQLSRILFEKLQINPPKKTLTGFSTSADVLETLQEEHPIIKKMMAYRLFEKLRSTYADALATQILPKTGRIHCTFNQSVAATGRLSCQDPNLQNIPVRSKEGRHIRSAFKPQHRGWSFLSADYSQIELRLLAHLSEDPSLIKAFNEGEDIHAFTASLIFNVPLKEVTPSMRHRAKAVNFGIIYGQQAFGLSRGLDIEYQEAATFIETYFQRYKKVKEFIEFCKEATRKTGKALSLTGRERPIPEINSKNPVLKAQAERLAVNTPLQGTAADLIKMAMIRVDALLQKQEKLGVMILQIHDELLFEVSDDETTHLSSHVKKIMETVFALKVPLVVDISIGKNWGEC